MTCFSLLALLVGVIGTVVAGMLPSKDAPFDTNVGFAAPAVDPRGQQHIYIGYNAGGA